MEPEIAQSEDIETKNMAVEIKLKNDIPKRIIKVGEVQVCPEQENECDIAEIDFSFVKGKLHGYF